MVGLKSAGTSATQSKASTSLPTRAVVALKIWGSSCEDLVSFGRIEGSDVRLWKEGVTGLPFRDLGLCSQEVTPKKGPSASPRMESLGLKGPQSFKRTEMREETV